MPLLILIAAGVLGGAVLVRFVVREIRRVNRELDEAREAKLDDRDGIRTLRRDPDSDTFRPS
ncbi:MAG: hypothetical protein NTZ72_17015 [Afipia sp.]|nr:hypothetical protein [Afipia sp.]